MRLAIVAFTRRGAALGRCLAGALGASLSLPPRIAESCGERAYSSLAAWTEENWRSCEGLIFVGTCGVAVRAIAPQVRSKLTDPAVVAVDEAGGFAIALLSGHVGGANDLARRVALITGAQAVITTATDINGVFAVDAWAKSRDLKLCDCETAKRISAALLEGESVGFSSDFEVHGELPPGLVNGRQRLNIRVTDSARDEPGVLRLIPKSLVLGLGCRRGKPAAELERAALEALDSAGLDRRAVSCAASIDLKRDESGLLELCSDWGLELLTYSAERLMTAEGEFQGSERVLRATGADNVCERAAVLAGGRLLVPKRARDGVTVAVGRRKLAIDLSLPGEPGEILCNGF